MSPLDALRDPQLTDDEIARQVAALGPVAEPASWWNDLANDRSYRPRHRAHAIVQLFSRHLRSGRLDVLAGATWLDRSSLATVDALAGKLPFPYDPEGTVAVCRLDRALTSEISTIYLRLEGRTTRDEILAAISGAGPAPVVRGYAILDGAGAVWASAP